jgi:hypothetical protein
VLPGRPADRALRGGGDQLDDLVGLLRDRGLPPDRVHQILGGNAMALLGRLL